MGKIFIKKQDLKVFNNYGTVISEHIFEKCDNFREKCDKTFEISDIIFVRTVRNQLLDRPKCSFEPSEINFEPSKTKIFFMITKIFTHFTKVMSLFSNKLSIKERTFSRQSSGFVCKI